MAADRIDDRHGIGVGLALNGEHDRAVVIEPACDLVVLDAVHDASNRLEMNRRAVAVGDHDLAVLLGLGHGARGRERHALLGSVESADRRIGVRLGNDGANVLERDVARSRGDGIDLDAYGEFLRAVDQYLRDAGKLRDLLGERDLTVFVDDRQRKSGRIQADIQNRKIARVYLPKARRNGHFDRKLASSNRERRLNVEGGAIDVAIEIELNRNGCNAEGR